MSVIVITGGSRGIGAGIAKVFAKAGHHLVLGYQKEQAKAERLAQALRTENVQIWPIQVDVRDADSVAEFFQTIDRFGELAGLINAAGISTYNLLQDVSLEEWENLFAVNIRGTFLCCREAVKRFLPRQEGFIINMSSMWGNEGAAMEVPYSASKGAVNAFTRALAKEVAYSKIRVNAIAPGPVETDMLKQLSPEDYAEMLEELPFQTLIQPEDVGNLALYLAQDGKQMTGQILTLDGGYCL